MIVPASPPRIKHELLLDEAEAKGRAIRRLIENERSQILIRKAVVHAFGLGKATSRLLKWNKSEIEDAVWVEIQRQAIEGATADLRKFGIEVPTARMIAEHELAWVDTCPCCEDEDDEGVEAAHWLLNVNKVQEYLDGLKILRAKCPECWPDLHSIRLRQIDQEGETDVDQEKRDLENEAILLELDSL